MNFACRLLLPLAAVAAFATPAYARSIRIPVDVTPAIEVSLQDGWIEKYDDYGNLTLFSESGGGLLFRTIEAGPNEPMLDNSAVAELILSAAGAKPYSRTAPTSFAGGPAEAFHSTMAVDGITIEIAVIVRKLGPRHLAIGVTMIPESTPSDQRSAIDQQFAQVRIVNR